MFVETLLLCDFHHCTYVRVPTMSGKTGEKKSVREFDFGQNVRVFCDIYMSKVHKFMK